MLPGCDCNGDWLDSAHSRLRLSIKNAVNMSSYVFLAGLLSELLGRFGLRLDVVRLEPTRASTRDVNYYSGTVTYTRRRLVLPRICCVDLRAD